MAGVTQKEAAMLYQGVYQPKVEYPLGQAFLTNKQVKKLESASMPKIIAKCEYNRNLKFGFRYMERTKRTWWKRILFLQKYS